MSDFDVDAAQQLCDHATEGPWFQGFDDGSGLPDEREGGSIFAEYGASVITGGRDDWGLRHGVMTMADSTFIAAARTLLPDALAEIRRLRAQVQRVETLCDALPALRELRAALGGPT